MALKLGLVLMACALLPAAPAQAAKRIRVTPAVTVTNANVELRGGGFRGADTVVRIGGKRAAVTRGTRKLLRVVVPSLKRGRHRVVAGRSRGRIRLVRPYAGRVRIKPDTSRRRRATIGPAGGRLTVTDRNGTRLRLTVPPDALMAATPIAIAPAKVSGLPFTGGRSAAAHFEPEGLRLARPARLEIKLRRRPRGRFVGFAAAGDGSGLGFAPARRSGRTLSVEVGHFSAGGAGSAAPADIVIFLQGIVESEFPLPVAQIELLRDQIGVWSQIWGEDVCIELCSAVQGIVVNSLGFHIDDVCDEGRAEPSLAAHTRIVALDALRSEFGGEDQIGAECAHEIVVAVVKHAIEQATPDPLVEADTGALPPNAGGLQLDAEPRLTVFEWLVYLSTKMQVLGENALRDSVDFAVDDGWAAIMLNKPGCDIAADRDRSTANLVTGWGYATALVDRVPEFESALDYCRVEVDMAPLSSFTPGEQRQLVPRVHHLVDPSLNNGVTWTASGGTITAEGLYTAPDTPGAYVVTLKSAHNPNRTWNAAVTVTCAPPGPLATRARAMAESAADQCTAASVAIDSRYSLLQALASAGLNQDASDLLETFALGDWEPPAVSASTSDDQGSASSSGSHVSRAVLEGGHLLATADIALSATVTGTAANAGSGTRHKVDFEVLAESVTYTLTGSIDAPAVDKGVAYVRLHEAGEGTDLFKTSAATPAESGTLPAGDYTLVFEANIEADASGGETVTGGMNATFSTSG